MSEPTLSEAQRALLASLPERTPVGRVDRLWIFPPRQISNRESGLFVLSLLGGEARREGQREVVTWRYEAERSGGRARRSDTVTGEGWAPAERVSRLIEGVLARLPDGAETPIERSVEGSETRWAALLAELGVLPLDSGGR